VGCYGISILVGRAKKIVDMKILRVINSLNIGGAERSVSGNVPIHKKNGFEIDVLLLNGTKTFFTEDLLKNNVKIISLGENNNIYNPLIIFKIGKFIKKYDVVHVSLFPALYWVALAKIITRSKAKLIYTEHSTSNRRRSLFLFKVLDQFIYKHYDKIIAITPEANINLSDHLKGNFEIQTIYNGVDVSKVFTDSQKKTLLQELEVDKAETKYLLQVASFRNQKDQDTVIRALPHMNPQVKLLFVGDGPRNKVCQELVHELDLTNRVSFLGLRDNVNEIYGLADIVVMSSHYEGFGRAAVEGMAARKPVIASNVAGLSEIVKNHGLLFTSGNSLELSKLVNELLSDKELYNEIAVKCFERALEFDIIRMIDSYEYVYKSLS